MSQFDSKEKVRKYQREYHRRYRSLHPGLSTKYLREWRKNNPERNSVLNRLNKSKRRARIASARVEPRINYKQIANWATRICGICFLQIEGDYHIDHIMPLARGGAHTVSNLQLTHPFCNRSKFTKLQS